MNVALMLQIFKLSITVIKTLALPWNESIVCQRIWERFLQFSLMGCWCSTSKRTGTPGYEEPTVLASQTPCEYHDPSLTGKSLLLCYSNFDFGFC